MLFAGIEMTLINLEDIESAHEWKFVQASYSNLEGDANIAFKIIGRAGDFDDTTSLPVLAIDDFTVVSGTCAVVSSTSLFSNSRKNLEFSLYY